MILQGLRGLVPGIALVAIVFVNQIPRLHALEKEEFLLKKGEIRIDGRIGKVNPARMTIEFIPTSFTLPNGRSMQVSANRIKMVHISTDTMIYVRGDRTESVTLEQLAGRSADSNILAITIGKDQGTGGELPAREIALWDRMESGGYSLVALAPPRSTSSARPATPAPSPPDSSPPAPQSTSPRSKKAELPTALSSDLLALFKFDGTAEDLTRRTPPAFLSGTRFVEDVLYLDGRYEYEKPPGYRTIIPIPQLDYNSFTVSLDFLPMGISAQHSNLLTGGVAMRWMVFGYRTGALELILNNHVFKHVWPEAVLQSGAWHNLMCSVDVNSNRIQVLLNGRSLKPIVLPPNFRFEVVGSSLERSDKLFTFTNYSNATCFRGCVGNFKVFRRPLSEAEMADLFMSSEAERAQLPHPRP